MNPKIYSTAVWVTNRKIEISSIKKHLTCTDELKSYFKNIYKIAYKLYYNKFFTKKVEHSYLGFEKARHSIVGDIRLDYVYIKNKFLDLESIHVHINFLTINKDFTFNGSSNHKLDELVRFSGAGGIFFRVIKIIKIFSYFLTKGKKAFTYPLYLIL